jgi:ABC-2 type transport system permease protein
VRRPNLRGYAALSRAIAKSALTYRLSFFLALGGVFFQLVAMLAVWRVLLAQGAVGGFTWPQMRTYLLVAFASGTLVSMFADFRMSFRILDGTVALDLVKPVGYQEARFAEVLGGVWIEILIVLLIGGAVTLAGGGLPNPGGGHVALFVASMALLIPLKFLVVYAGNLLIFWTQNFVGVQWARVAIVNLLSGALVPLAYLPHWLGAVATWSPFGGMASTPGVILVGRVDAGRALLLIGVQAGWVVVLWFGAKLLWRSAVKQLTVNGG